MISTICENSRRNRNCSTRKRNPLLVLSNLFKRKPKESDVDVDKESQKRQSIPRNGSFQLDKLGKNPSQLSNSIEKSKCCSAMDMHLRMSSPTLSTLTLTPGRTRDIDLDMQALRLSRQDNPFLQVLASRESLADSIYKADSDDANLMSHDMEQEIDPLSLPEIHQHMIRSPPPTTWPRSPDFRVFQFPDDSVEGENIGTHQRCSTSVGKLDWGDIGLRPSSGFRTNPQRHRTTSSSSSECGLARPVAGSHQSLLKKAPVRSLSDVRRHQVNEDERIQRKRVI